MFLHVYSNTLNIGYKDILVQVKDHLLGFQLLGHFFFLNHFQKTGHYSQHNFFS